MTITEKIAYIQGVADTLDLKTGDKKDQLIVSLIDAMNEMALAISDLETGLDTLGAQVDEIDEDLGAVEEEIYGCDDDCDCCDCDCDDDCDCCCGEDDTFLAVCPQCGNDIEVAFDDLEVGNPIVCPNCDAELEFDYAEVADDDEDLED